jgi:hypothetical protein
MPAERVAMRQVREIIRLKFSAGVPIKTPRADVKLVETRLKAVLGRYRNERE